MIIKMLGESPWQASIFIVVVFWGSGGRSRRREMGGSRRKEMGRLDQRIVFGVVVPNNKNFNQLQLPTAQ